MTETHPDIEALIAYQEAALSHQDAASIERHLLDCDVCLQELVRIGARLHAMRNVVASDDPPTHVAAIGRGAGDRKRSPRPVAATALAALSFAAGLVLAIGARSWTTPAANRIHLRSAEIAVAATEAAPSVRLVIDPVAADVGSVVELAVRLESTTGQASAIEFDLQLDERLRVTAGGDGRPDCSVNPAINKEASGFSFRPARCGDGNLGCEVVHAVILAADNREPIADDSELFRCRMRIPPQVPDGAYPIHARNARYAPPSGDDLEAAVSEGWVVVGQAVLPSPTAVPIATTTPTHSGGSDGGGCAVAVAPPGLASWLPLIALALLRRRRRRQSRDVRRLAVPASTLLALVLVRHAADGEVRLRVEPTATNPGSPANISVILETTDNEEVVAVQNRLSYDATFLSVASSDEARPSCRVPAGLEKEASAFGFRGPCSVETGICSSLQAVIVSLTNFDPIPSGAVLYQCDVVPSLDTLPGSYRIHLAEVLYSSGNGTDRPGTGIGGDLLVLDPSPPTPTHTATTTPTPVPTRPSFDVGDANCDGRLDGSDVSVAVRAIFALRQEGCSTDCNRDGSTDSSDITCTALEIAAAVPSLNLARAPHEQLRRVP